MTRRRRVVSEAELALWTRVAETVKPLPGRPKLSPPPEPPKSVPEPPPVPAPPTMTAPAPKRPVAAPPPPPLAPLEHKMRRRLARGAVAIDARIDLHGLRQEEAHRRLASFLIGAQASGCKLVLVITGKGRPSAPGDGLFGEERGVLRRSVPLWLGSPAARHIVVGFETADVVHGGAGALYVRIRKGGMRR